MKLPPHPDVLLLLNKIKSDYESKNIEYTSTEICSWEDFINQPLPDQDVEKAIGDYYSVASFGNKYLRAAVQIVGAEASSNAILYRPQSVMGWHTNSDMIGQRIYYTYTEGPAAFMYLNKEGERIIDYDNIGWTCRSFDIKGPENPLWHTIWTEKQRYSFGFWIKCQYNT